jgi:class 3 adenylate cyclase
VHGGTVVHLLGDGVTCAFGVPRVAGDGAIRAVRAAVGIQRAFREFAREERAVGGDVGLRVAVHTGGVVVTDDYTAGIGDPLHVAARLQQEIRTLRSAWDISCSSCSALSQATRLRSRASLLTRILDL